jgi:outer membrane receptor protein involved in Fe transport
MRKRCIRSGLLAVLLLSSVAAWAGTTGKIRGRVIDKESGEPLIGANIVVEGTMLGAAAGPDGEYVILNVPPGTYTLVASMIGYQTVRASNVQVNADLTTIYNFALGMEIIAGETVEIVAERPLIQADLTSSQSVISSEEIAALPIETFSEVVQLKAGVVEGAGGTLHIRGGRYNETAFLVNGVSVSNPFNNTLGIEVAANAIQELTLVSGTFNAEYGNAMSGVINVVTKEGGSRFTGQLTAYSGDNVSNKKDLFFNVDKVKLTNNAIVEGTLGGPVPLSSKLSFFLSGRYNNDEGWLYGVREHRPGDYADFTVFPESQTTLRTPRGDTVRVTPGQWYIEMTGDGAIVPLNPRVTLNTTAKLTWRVTPVLKINYDFILDKSDRDRTFSWAWRYNPDGRPQQHYQGITHALGVSHALSKRTFYTAKFALSTTELRRFLYEDPKDPRYVADFFLRRPNNFSFFTGGNDLNHLTRESQTILAKFDITSQLNNRHQVKTGVEMQLHRLDYEEFAILYTRPDGPFPQPTVPPINTPAHDKYRRKPTQFAAYLQDKIEYRDMIINVGLRVDRFDAKAPYATDVFDPANPQKRATATPKTSVSPRLGLSFPITDRGIIRVSYGHFVQMPTLTTLYVNPEFEAVVGTTNIGTFGNANLKPERTIAYEVGLQQQLTDDIAFDLTGYFKDVRNLLAFETKRLNATTSYNTYVNKDYGNIRGISFSLSKRPSRTSLFSASLDYTLQFAEGNSTDQNAFFVDFVRGRESERQIVYLDWDQRHTLNVTATLSRPEEWGVSVIGQLGTGLPYSPSLQGVALDRPNSGRKPTQINVDLKAFRSLRFLGLNSSVFVKVFNLFDRKNERFVYDDTGTARYSLIPTYAGQDLRNQADTPGVHQIEEYLNRADYYKPPREILVGFKIDF